MRYTAKAAYEKCEPGELWCTLDVYTQDAMTDFAEAVVAGLGDDGACVRCGDNIAADDVTCEKCWLIEHAETCAVCNGDIPMSRQRCWRCTAEKIRDAMVARGVAPSVIDEVLGEVGA